MSVSDSYVKEKRMQAYDGVGELISYLKFTYFGSTEGWEICRERNLLKSS
jgi:hypothetical protein